MINKKKGFTLIELLVAIAIIGILASILIVGLTKAKQKANQARAWQSFNQIALAMQLYYDKNNDWPNPTGNSFTMYSCWGSASCIADFADDSDPNNKFYPEWDASWYCSGCKYNFNIYDFNNDLKPDIGYINISGSSTIYKFIPCITNNTKLGTTEYCGRRYP